MDVSEPQRLKTQTIGFDISGSADMKKDAFVELNRSFSDYNLTQGLPAFHNLRPICDCQTIPSDDFLN